MSAERYNNDEDKHCAIVDGAVIRANEMGLDGSRVFCPLIHVCTGESCMFADKDETEVKAMRMAVQIDTFYMKLKVHDIMAQRNRKIEDDQGDG